MKGFGNIMQQAAKMQQKLEEIQKTAANKTVETTSGGGMVKVTINGKQEVLSLEIDDSVFEEKDKDMLQDLILAAVNKGIQDSQAMVKEEMSKLAGSMGLPNIPGLF